MTPPPLPPHERAWRHPSELPAPPHEPPTRGGRLLIVATATIGLALVGVMALRMTPGRTTHRDALVTVSTSSVFTGASANTLGELAGAAGNGGRRFTDLLGRTLSSFVSSSERDQAASPAMATIAPSPSEPSGPGNDTLAMVTPIGDDGLGVTTAAAVEGDSGTIEAMLPSGAVVTAELVGGNNGVALVRLPDVAIRGAAELAETPGEELTVVAFGDEFDVGNDDDDLRTLAVPEAAPIFDADGELVGLCTIGPDGIELLPVTSLPDVALPPPASSDPESTVAVTDSTADSDTTVGTDAAQGSATSSPASSASTIAPGTTSPPDSTATSSSEPSSSSAPESSAAPAST